MAEAVGTVIPAGGVFTRKAAGESGTGMTRTGPGKFNARVGAAGEADDPSAAR